MLLTNRRHRWLHIAIAAMEVGWIAPWTLLFLGFWQQRLDAAFFSSFSVGVTPALQRLLDLQPVQFYALLLGLMLAYMLAADLLNRATLGWPWRDLTMLTLVAVTSLLLVRLVVRPSAAAEPGTWLAGVWRSLFDFTQGRRPELAVLLVSGFLWFRVSVSTDRDLGFFSVALNFRLGLLTAIAGGALLAGMGAHAPRAALALFACFMVPGLTAVALARTNERAYTVDGSRGALLPWSRLLQIVGSAVAIVVLGGLVALLYTPANLRAVIGWFAPLWRLLAAVVGWTVYAVAWGLAPVMEWLINLLRRLIERANLFDAAETPPTAGELINIEITPNDVTAFLDRWTYVRYGLVLLIVALVLGLIWIFFVRTRHTALDDETELTTSESMTLGGALFWRGRRRLRDLLDLLQQYGISAQLLAAISIQNIYANVGRIASRRGWPRRPSQPPDDYLPVLCMAFPGFETELTRITEAYMRVAYGDRSLDEIELSVLRQDYRALQSAPPPTTEPEIE